MPGNSNVKKYIDQIVFSKNKTKKNSRMRTINLIVGFLEEPEGIQLESQLVFLDPWQEP